ncbi:hypothetical protein [Cellulosimicrobium composti]|uniref:F5/8 type C domain-containing protein n=1 Tax=Cellulosimicrobium composti TaxID=2672572 RepID=A0ABX0BIK9_9MICO|nr:hypothetical protein [Cellulosimicrobium composti]NDO90619.1 hypothetical protein [Cellulosimicrobium composti]
MTSDQDDARAHRRVDVTAVSGVVAAVAAVVAAVALGGGGTSPAPDAATTGTFTPSAVPATAPVTQSGALPLCGFPRLEQVTDDGVDAGDLGGIRTVVDDVVTLDDGDLVTFRVLDGAAYVLEWDREATYTVTRYDLATGDVEATTPVALDRDAASETFRTDSFEVDADGSVYLLDTLERRRDLVKVAPDGSRTWTATLPEGERTTGDLLDLYGTVRWTVDGRTVVGVQEAGTVLHEVTDDGEVLGEVPFEGAVLAQLPDGTALVETDERDDERRSLDLRAVGPDGEVPGSRLGASWERGRAFGVPRVPWLDDTTGATTGPAGHGLVVADENLGFRWWGSEGVFRGVWPDTHKDLEQPFALWERTPVLRDGTAGDAPYYVLTHGEDGGFSITEITADRMAYQLGAPVKYNAANEELFGGLGLGAGLLVDAPYGVFPDGTEPRVVAAFDDAWGAHAGTYRLRYQVRGDPRVWDPVVGEETVVDLPADGGEVALDLPAARPGVYEVDAALVDAATGDAVSGTCLRYTVAAAGSRLDPGALADGADWGGAGPLRGVQLAHQLGVGSHRTQLDFGAIVPDPTAEPDPAALVWDSLPNAAFAPDEEEGEEPAGVDPFAELAAAAELAEETGVVLALQLGSGGEAEQAAVEAGTWEGWVRAIVAVVHERAPQVRYWQPWNEPNATGFADATVYEAKVGAPFAAGARAADADVVVVGGNTLGIEPAWWVDLVLAGGCDSLDVVGIHPYTGFNRSWEEEGFSADDAELDALREALSLCGDVPVWDTESGWWSDGVANFWAGGSDVVRKLLWYGLEGVDEWTYFFSEGGFGEAGNSWSLLQYGQYVKPAGAAFAASAPFLDGFGTPEPVATGTPGVHAVRAPGAGEHEGAELLALWSEDLSTTVRLSAPGGAVTVTARDPYGAERGLEVPTGGVEVPVNGAPVLLVAPAGTALEVAPVEAFGDDVLEGRPVTATSTHEDANDPAVVTSGTFAVREPWRSGRLPDGSVDEAPGVEITTDGTRTIDRVAVATAGIRCCTSGLRDYTVSVRTPDGAWRDVAEQTDQFLDRVALFSFAPVEVTAVRVTLPMTTERDVPVLAANYTGIVGGLHPDFLPLATESEWIATISAVRAWEPAG